MLKNIHCGKFLEQLIHLLGFSNGMIKNFETMKTLLSSHASALLTEATCSFTTVLSLRQLAFFPTAHVCVGLSL